MDKCIESDEVHDEIRALAVREKKRILALKNPDEATMLEALQQYGPAPGAQKMMDLEMEAALTAIQTGMYVVFRSCTGEDCTRVGPSHMCFCSHKLGEHTIGKRKTPCSQCGCGNFEFMFSRPEEIGEYWLVRRKDFNIHTWSAKCRCKHGHKQHRPDNTKRCMEGGCRCQRFDSAFCCLVCDKHWEEHETVFETEAERRAVGKPTGEAFKPLAQVNPEFSEIVFGKKNDEGVYVKAMPNAYQQRLKPAQPKPKAKVSPRALAGKAPIGAISAGPSSSCSHSPHLPSLGPNRPGSGLTSGIQGRSIDPIPKAFAQMTLEGSEGLPDCEFGSCPGCGEQFKRVVKFCPACGLKQSQ